MGVKHALYMTIAGEKAMNNDFLLGIAWGFIPGVVFGIAMYSATQDVRAQSARAQIDAVKLHYSKDDRGNCFASELHSQRFTWVPCDGQTLQTK